MFALVNFFQFNCLQLSFVVQQFLVPYSLRIDLLILLRLRKRHLLDGLLMHLLLFQAFVVKVPGVFVGGLLGVLAMRGYFGFERRFGVGELLIA